MHRGLLPDGWDSNLGFCNFPHCLSRAALFLSPLSALSVFHLSSSWLLAARNVLIYLCVYSSPSQPRHYGHFGPDHSWLPGCPVWCRISVPGLHPLDASGTVADMTIRYVCRHCQMFPAGKWPLVEKPWLQRCLAEQQEPHLAGSVSYL